MRLMRRNKKTIWVANFDKKIPFIDENGDYSGEEEVKYSQPYAIKASVSGEISFQYREYGIHDVGTKIVIVEPDVGRAITESSKIWIDSNPSKPANYVVERLDNSLNYTIIVCSRSGGRSHEN